MVKLIDVTGVGPVAAKLLAEHKIKTVDALASISLAELQKIPGFSGNIRACAVRKAAVDCLQGKVTSKVVEQLAVPVRNPQTTASKVIQASIAKSTAIDPAVNQVATDEVKKKDGKKKEKVKDKNKKKKSKNKDKNKKKGGKKKRKEKNKA